MERIVMYEILQRALRREVMFERVQHVCLIEGRARMTYWGCHVKICKAPLLCIVRASTKGWAEKLYAAQRSTMQSVVNKNTAAMKDTSIGSPAELALQALEASNANASERGHSTLVFVAIK